MPQIGCTEDKPKLKLVSGEAQFVGPIERTKIRGSTQASVAPSLSVGKQGRKQMPRMRMARARAAKSSDNRAAGKVEIAERVEQLMANKFVSIAQAACFQDVVSADHNDVVERPAPTEARFPQTINFVEKAKCARSAELSFECRRIEHHTHVLSTNQRVGETYFEAHRKAVIGQQSGRCTVLANAYRF